MEFTLSYDFLRSQVEFTYSTMNIMFGYSTYIVDCNQTKSKKIESYKLFLRLGLSFLNSRFFLTLSSVDIRDVNLIRGVDDPPLTE